MKKVVKADIVVDLFAAQAQEYACTPSRNLYFHDNVLFSYGSHYAVAVLRGKVALVNNTRYSVTTSKHTSMAAVALERAGYDVIMVDNPMASAPEEHSANMVDLQARRDEGMAKGSRARSEHMIEAHARDVKELSAMITAYYDLAADSKPEFTKAA